MKGDRYSYHGEMLTKKEIADRAGVSLDVVRKRARSGWPTDMWGEPRGTIVRPNSYAVQKSKAYRYNCRGQMLTLKEMSKIYGVCIHTVRSRKRAGLPVDMWVAPVSRYEKPELKLTCSKEEKDWLYELWQNSWRDKARTRQIEFISGCLGLTPSTEEIAEKLIEEFERRTKEG